MIPSVHKPKPITSYLFCTLKPPLSLQPSYSILIKWKLTEKAFHTPTSLSGSVPTYAVFPAVIMKELKITASSEKSTSYSSTRSRTASSVQGL